MRRKGAILKNRSACVIARVMETEENKMTLTNLSPRLTAAEKRVLALVSAAKTNKEIAFALGISPGHRQASSGKRS